MEDPNQQSNTDLSQHPKSHKTLITVLVVMVALLVAGVVYLLVREPSVTPPDDNNQLPIGQDLTDLDGQSCSKDAFTCQDGTVVGRVPPTCEFAACPLVDETANWQTYRNEEFGFSLSYPNNWEQNQLASGGGEFKLIASFEPGSIVPAGNNMTVFINEDSIDATKEDDEVNRLYTYSKISVSGRDAYISDIKVGIEGGIQRVLIDSPQGTILILAEGKTISNLNQILSTFKFIE